MKVQDAITAFSQSEKIKSGLIWLSQSLEMQRSLSEPERQGAEKTVHTILGMIGSEIHLSRRITRDSAWEQAEKHVDLSLVMLSSGIPHEAVFHITRALSQITDIAQRAMSFLKSQGLL